jgi:hypothetical protein
MTQVFGCPSCGASLDHAGDEPVVRCAYCDTAVIVPEGFRSQVATEVEPLSGTTEFSATPLTVDLSDLMSALKNLRKVKGMVRQGRATEATRLVQKTMGVSELEAREIVGRLAAGQGVVLGNSTSYSASIPLVSGPQASATVAEQIDMARDRQRQTNRVATVVVLAILICLIAMIGVFMAASAFVW